MRLGRAAALAVVVSTAPAWADTDGDAAARALARLAAATGEDDAALVRIGLEPAHVVRIGCDRAFRLVDPATGETVWRPSFAEEVQVVADGGPRGAVPSVWRVQAGAFSSPAAARAELERLERASGAAGVVHHDPDRGTWRVRLGAANDAASLGPLVDRLREQGIAGAWITEEPREAVGEVRLRLVDASYESVLSAARRLAAVPERGGRIQVDGKPYRGLVELRLSPFGSVRPINWVGLESYLLGVVPAELGPEVWPQLAALQAQAVAARTYVRANLGQFEEQGFDLCSTPRCQVYAGAAAEHPLSNRAVWSTRGEILEWEGRPIAALYTATCGGHTEFGAEIFPEHDAPYLRGVPCRAEGDAVAGRVRTLSGRKLAPRTDDTGTDVTRDWTLLETAGVFAPAPGARADGRPTVVDGPRLRQLTRALARLAGRPEPAGDPPAASSVGTAAAAVVSDLGWDERARVLLSSEDARALLREPELAELPEAERRALAVLAWSEALYPHGDGRFRAAEPMTLERLAPLLVGIGQSYEAFGLRSANVAAVEADGLRLIQGKGALALRLARAPALFGLSGGRSVALERLALWPGDAVRFRTSAEGTIDFLELAAPVKGAADDRSAKVYSWEVRRTRGEIEAAIARRAPIGELRGLEVVRRGVSGRVVELRVVGSQGSTVVRGFDVRTLLDLRESLLVIEPQRDAAGAITAVVFAGKGWGHGVGMCQVGAYGMALRGASYREILAHYYPGATLAGAEPAPG